MKQKRTTNEILNDLDNTLETAKFGLDDLLEGVPNRRISGLRNLIVFGRAVTNVLQNLRSIEPDFDEWYQPFQDEMKKDPVAKYFYKLRSEILKQGKMKVSSSLHIKHFNTSDMHRFGKPPEGARGFFMGDLNGGSGWEVELPDGTIEKFYVELPSDIGTTELIFPEVPENHFGEEIKDTSVENLSKLYFSYLENLVQKAKDKYKK